MTLPRSADRPAVLTVTLNPALDVTYEVARLRVGGSNRVERVHTRPGGKGVNAARVLHGRGIGVLATGLVGGRSGEILRAGLARAGISHEFLPVTGETRRTVTVVERPSGAATVLTEPGPVVQRPEWHVFVARFGQLCDGVRVVVLAGSLPPGVPPDAYAQLVRRAQAAGADTVVDAAGVALRHAVAARPTVVKANAEEFVAGVGCASVDAGLAQVVSAGVALAVVTMGADGLAAATARGRLRASPPARVKGNATGAGDACTAALAAALAAGSPFEESLRDALALSAAAVAAPVAGEFDDAVFRRFRETARVVADS